MVFLEVGNVHYVVTPFQTATTNPVTTKRPLAWLANDLANTDPDMKVVMFNHTVSPSENYVIEFDRQSLDLKDTI